MPFKPKPRVTVVKEEGGRGTRNNREAYMTVRLDWPDGGVHVRDNGIWKVRFDDGGMVKVQDRDVSLLSRILGRRR